MIHNPSFKFTVLEKKTPESNFIVNCKSAIYKVAIIRNSFKFYEYYNHVQQRVPIVSLKGLAVKKI